MNKKDRLKGFLSGVVLTVLLISSISVFASGWVRQPIQVIYNNIKLVVDGKPIKFGKDSAGKQIEPFIYNGTTYLPVRAVGEALGKKVDWDGTTQTVYIGEKPGEISYMTETIEPYSNYYVDIYKLNNPKKFSMGGVEYKTGYKFGGYGTRYLMFNLNGQYSEISGTLGVVSWNYLQVRDLNIYLDGKLYKTISVNPNKLPEDITIPVKGVMQLKLESPYNGTGGSNGDTYIGFGNVIIK